MVGVIGVLCLALGATGTNAVLAPSGALRDGIGKLPLRNVRTLTVLVVPPQPAVDAAAIEDVMTYAQLDLAVEGRSVTAILGEDVSPTKEALATLYRDAGTDGFLVLRLVPTQSARDLFDLQAQVLDHSGTARARFALARAVHAPSTPPPAAVAQPAASPPVPSPPATTPAPQPMAVAPASPPAAAPAVPPVAPAPAPPPATTALVLEFDPAALSNAVAKLVAKTDWSGEGKVLVYAALPADDDGGGPAFHHLWRHATALLTQALEAQLAGWTVEAVDDSAFTVDAAVLAGRAARKRARRHVVAQIKPAEATVTLQARQDHRTVAKVTLTAASLRQVPAPAQDAGAPRSSATRAWRKAAFLEQALVAKEGVVTTTSGVKRDLKAVAAQLDDPSLDRAVATSSRNSLWAGAVASLGLAGCVMTGISAGILAVVLMAVGASGGDNTWLVGLGSACAVCICMPLGQLASWAFWQTVVGIVCPVTVDAAVLRRATQKFNRRLVKKEGVDPADVEESLVGENDDDDDD